MNKKKLIKFFATVITALIFAGICCLAIWLICIGFGIEFNIKYVCPVLAFILLNKFFPFQVHRIISK